ncbi:hypothetical protein [Pedobacter zeae]|uniref:Uncharacterized protein n=1 Tax=Pedobacter zeae TaxID=1737356 RepID=A0A7W6K9D2_9SPHI|nr:hypothetical protein [Pedobacter zeae]MBB4106651.1 hypothetical protein [Pedobacter zeae]GGH02931.1 hypothetical protein GCM10007422_17680 [Pedobacter zeae]
MKIKATKDKIAGISLLLGVLMEQNKPRDIAETLIYLLVDKVFTKVRAKAESLWSPKSGWGVNLTDMEAMALFIFLQQVHIPERLYKYEAIQLNDVSNQIEKVYGALKVA